MKKIIIILGVALIIGLGVYFFINNPKSPGGQIPAAIVPTEGVITTVPAVPATTPIQKPLDTTKTVLGTSAQSRNITAYHYGTGGKELLFVGGVHGGYSWNTVLLAYELMDYLAANPSAIPSTIKVTVIPVLNPDGLYKVTGSADRFKQADVSTSKNTVIAGRFNANNVDLSRNFDCNWKSKGLWMTETVSGGTKAFSEPESLAFKNYVEAHNLAAAIVWYSSAGGVFSSSCENGIMPETKAITNTFALASGYKAYDSYNFYETTGDLVNWLAKKKIPAISVLLTTHQDTEWSKNLAGIKALLKYYGK